MSQRWLTSNLAALGSAAVLSVYAAGYVRTKPAADRFADEANDRRPPAAPPPTVAVGRVDTAPAPVTSPAVEIAKPKIKLEPKARADTVSIPKQTRDSVPMAMPVADVPPAPAPPLPAAATDTAKAPEKALIVLKDGVYSGWGTSRHGDIQAYVEIKGSKIISAFISECLTQYSCSWIAKLPPQVVARQSPEVDYVSGATQSTNAFYYAVVDALKKAK